MKKVVSFDLDGTLVHGRFGDMVWHHGIPEKYAETYGISKEEAQALIVKEYEAMGDSNLLWYDVDWWIRKFELPLDPKELLDRYAEYIEATPYAFEVIEALRRRYRLVVASNAARIFVEKELAHVGLTSCFEQIISATSDFGMVKKEARFFQTLCTTLDIEPCELVHVGDHAVFDHEVPRSLGIEAFRYYPSGETNGSTINDLRELLKHL